MHWIKRAQGNILKCSLVLFFYVSTTLLRIWLISPFFTSTDVYVARSTWSITSLVCRHTLFCAHFADRACGETDLDRKSGLWMDTAQGKRSRAGARARGRAPLGGARKLHFPECRAPPPPRLSGALRRAGHEQASARIRGVSERAGLARRRRGAGVAARPARRARTPR